MFAYALDRAQKVCFSACLKDLHDFFPEFFFFTFQNVKNKMAAGKGFEKLNNKSKSDLPERKQDKILKSSTV